MYNLLKINSVLIEAIKYKAIRIDNEYIYITNYRFRRYIVNYDGEFIGEKYKKFLWFKSDSYEYESYKYALTKRFNIGFYDGHVWQDSRDIKSLLQDVMDTEIFSEEANKLFVLLEKAEANVEEQNQILTNLEKKREEI